MSELYDIPLYYHVSQKTQYDEHIYCIHKGE